MNGMNSTFVCGLIVVLGTGLLPLYAQSPEGVGSPKAAGRNDPFGVEKSVLTESSKQAAEPAAAKDEFCHCVNQKESAAAKKIEQALSGPLRSSGLDVADVPLSDLLTQLQAEYQIQIQMDRAALEAAGVGTDAPVTKSLHNISLRSALRLTLEPLDLTWILRDEVLMITTAEAANRRLVTCVYNVQGLVDDSDPKSMDGLINAVHACVAPDTWATNGGKQADIRALKPGLLVVSQTPSIHEEINGLLAKIRKVREQVPATKSRPSRQPEKVRDAGENSANANPFGG
jgi:hypothetical protein